MNILREFRRSARKSKIVRVRLILIFAVILIVNTYAWFNIDKELKLGGIENKTIPWDVTYYVDGKEIFDQDVTFTIDELYPGMSEREQTVHIYNLSTTSSSIKYELKSVKVFGQEVLEQLKADGVIHTNGNTTNIFGDDSVYPFDITYTYDKTRIDGEYVDDATTPQAGATFKYNLNWEYEGIGQESENLAKDILDTKFGKDAYAFYKDEANDPSKAIEITVKITSSMIPPGS